MESAPLQPGSLPPQPGSLPPHPGSFWQECADPSSGYPYYWNTVTNQVVWECPSELNQYRHSLLALPPPNPPPPQVKKISAPLSSLVSGYDSEEEGEGEVEVLEPEDEMPAEKLEQDPEFIGPKIPKLEEPAAELVGPTIPRSEEPDEGESGGTESQPVVEEQDQAQKLLDTDVLNGCGGEAMDPDDDILSRIEAELPPDYQMNGETQAPLPPSFQPQYSPACPPPPPEEPPPPPPPLASGQSSISLLCSYADSDLSDSDTEEVQVTQKSRLKPVTGQLDSSGRIIFPSNGNWQTEEQRLALDSYRVEQLDEAMVDSRSAGGKAGGAVNSRKRRIALPGGKFNKSSDVPTETKPIPPSDDLKKKYAVQFVKSSTILPGSLGEEPRKEEVEARVDRLVTSGPQLPTQEEADSIDGLTEEELAEELVEKLEYFKVGSEKISSLKLLAVKIETLYSAWSAGALTSNYLKIFLENAHRRIRQTESSQLQSGAWCVGWDRDRRRYRFTHSDTGETTWEKPRETMTEGLRHLQYDSEFGRPPVTTKTTVATPPPPLPSSPPPPPPPSSPPRPQSPEDTGPQDMDLEEDDSDDSSPSEPELEKPEEVVVKTAARLEEVGPENTVNITDELSSFYSEIGFSDPVAEDDGAQYSASPVPNLYVESGRVARTEPQPPGVEDLRPPGEEGLEDGEVRSAPSSPAPLEPKRRKKAVKVTSSLSMKKKGLNNMLAKWQNVT